MSSTRAWKYGSFDRCFAIGSWPCPYNSYHYGELMQSRFEVFHPQCQVSRCSVAASKRVPLMKSDLVSPSHKFRMVSLGDGSRFFVEGSFRRVKLRFNFDTDPPSGRTGRLSQDQSGL